MFRLENPHGLHARPAARLVSEVRALDATVQLRNLTTGAGPVPAGSLSRVASLSALQGHDVEVRASGPQAQEAVEHLVALAKRRFDEQVEQVVAPPAAGPSASSRTGPAAGVAGHRHRTRPSAHRRAGRPRRAHRGRASGRVAARLPRQWRPCAVRSTTSGSSPLREVGAEQAGIFDAHLSLLTDAELLADVKSRIGAGVGAVAAWADCLADVERQWANLPDPYLRERAADVRAVREQVLRALTGQVARRMTAPGVLVADDLTPAETAGLDLELVTGVVLAQGSPTSHAAILARARDIPVVVAAGPEVLDIPEGTTVVLDGEQRRAARRPAARAGRGVPASRPSRTPQQRAQQLALADRARGAPATGRRSSSPPTSDPSPTPGPHSRPGPTAPDWFAPSSSSSTGTSHPTSRSSTQSTTAIAAAMGGRRITLRTLDVGGDKPLPYLQMPAEANPFLGRRGIRLSLEHRDLLRDQMVAICHTARHHPTSIMIPMVSTPDEMIEARQVLTDAAGPSGIPPGLRLGTMIEVPSAALKIEAFLPHVDFVSIGTNDLTQYALAAERGNSAVAALSDALDPGVLRLIDHVCRAARGRIDVAVCGEAASDELAIPILVGLGVRQLSVAPPAVPRVKAAIRELDVVPVRVAGASRR